MKWNKTLKRISIGIAALLAMAVTGAVIYVRTDAFHRFVGREIIEQVQKNTGARVEIGSFTLHWSHWGADFYGITLHGTESNTQPPLLTAEHLGVELKIISFFRKDVELREIAIDGPVLHVSVDRDGNSNLPQAPGPRKEPASPAASVFNMGIRHVAITAGQVFYNDYQTPLSGELHDLQARIVSGVFSQACQGSLSYDQGRLVFRDFNPVTHAMELNFTADRNGVTLSPGVVHAGGSRVTLQATMTNYANPQIEGKYEADVFTGEVGKTLKVASMPAGEVRMNGALGFRNVPQQPALNGLRVDGQLQSARVLLAVGQAGAAVTSVRGSYVLANGNLRVRNVEAKAAGGSLAGNFEMDNLSGNTVSRVALTVSNASLLAVSQLAGTAPFLQHPVAGQMDLKAQAGWAGSFSNLKGHANATVRAPSEAAASGSIPLSGEIDVDYDRPWGVASFGHSHLEMRQTQIAIDGTLSNHSNLNVELNTEDLYELSTLVTEVTPVPGHVFDVHGPAHLKGVLHGPINSPTFAGGVSANDFKVQGAGWRLLRANVKAQSSGVEIKDGELASSQQGQIAFEGRVGLDGWSFRPDSPISAEVKAAKMPVVDLEHFANVSYPVSGVLAATISFQGSEQTPAGHGSIQITQGRAWNQVFRNLSVQFQGDGKEIHSTAEVETAAGSASAKLTYAPATQEYDASVNSAGLALDQIQAVETRDLNIHGKIAVTASGHGTVKDPQLDAKFEIGDLEVQDKKVSGVRAELNVAQERARFTLHSEYAQGAIEGKGTVALTGERMATASLDVTSMPIAALLVAAGGAANPAAGVTGETEIHATMQGPLKDLARVEGHVEIRKLTLAYQDQKIEEVDPIRFDYRNGIVTVSHAELKGNGSDLSFEGTVPLKSETVMNVSAKGAVDLALLKALGAEVDSSGRVEMNVSARGSLKAPEVNGEFDVKNAVFSSPSAPIAFEGVNAKLALAGNRLEITQFTGSAGGGTITARGSMVYGKNANFDLAMNVQSVRLRYPEGVRAVLQGDLQLTGSPDDSNLTGRILIERLSFTRGFDLATFMSQFSDEPTSGTPPDFEQNMKLNVALQSTSSQNLASSTLSIEGSANLNVRGTAATPVLLGRATLSGGEIFFMGNRYEVQNGTIDFSNPARTEPNLNIYVTTTVQQYNVTLNFVGTPDKLRTNYSSTPPLAPADIINLVAFGQTSEQSASAGSTPATLGAESVLAEGVSSQVGSRLGKLAGISQLTIDPSLGGNSQDPGARVAIQQRVTGSLLVTFSTDVTTTQSEAIEVEYQPKKQVSFSVLRDQNGGYGVGVRIHKAF
ncbi:MAG: translocation/assembly module TamB domain-containing protein [Candidatus Acidiferrales bacterium]